MKIFILRNTLTAWIKNFIGWEHGTNYCMFLASATKRHDSVHAFAFKILHHTKIVSSSLNSLYAKLIWYSVKLRYTVICRYNAVRFLQNIHNTHPIARASLGVSFVNASLDYCSVSVTAVMDALSCFIAPRYNGAPLYLDCLSFINTLMIRTPFHMKNDSPFDHTQSNPCLLMSLRYMRQYQ